MMAVKELVQYCTKNPCYQAGKRINRVAFLVVHSPAVIRASGYSTDAIITGNQWHTRWNKENIEKLAHGVIDTDGVHRFAPDTLACWHVGNSYGNANSLGFEFCEYTDQAKARQVYQNGVEYYAALCRKYGLKETDIYGHHEAHEKGWASNHSDPGPYFATIGKTMKDFRTAVKNCLDGAGTGKKSNAVTEPAVVKTYTPPAYARVCNLTAGDHLNVRTAPNADANRLAAWPELSEGNEVDVVEMYTNGWAKVLIQGNVGYVNAHYLAITERSQPASTPAPAQSYTEWAGRVHDVDPVGLIVRTGPGKGYDRLASYPKLYDGNMVSVMGEQSGYYHIRISNPVAGTHIGWVSKDYVSRG